ncbi:MAG: hypothetical protein HY731_00010 [Candidatus Tectomicrobia bacterium]|nr:hypothetical protein [Candidatus Tectomicrobia bacterium]
MAVRWLSRSRLSMQRLGFCKAVLAFSELARSPGQMADTLRSRLEEQKFSVPYDEVLVAWLKGLNKAAQLNPEISISLQKLYIYSHPSRTGWLSRLAFNEYVEYLPQRLGLVTGSYEATDMGLVLSQGLMSSEQHEAFTRPSTSNPLVLDTGGQIFFLYNLLAADGDFLLPFCGALLHRFGAKSFSYLDAGSLVPDTIADILSRFSGSVYTTSDREQLDRLESTRKRISREIEQKIEKQGSGSRREQTTVPRLEWLVDLGLAERVESRTWRFTQTGLKLAEYAEAYRAEMSKRYPENVMKALLDSWFFGFVARAYGRGPGQGVTKEQFLIFVWPAYQRLAGVGGYALLRPCLLYANILSLLDQRGLFLEYDETTRLLEDIYRLDPTAVHYTIDRFNTDYQVRVHRTPKTD